MSFEGSKYDGAEGSSDMDAEMLLVGDGGSAEDARFDNIVGCLEELLMDEAFSSARDAFCKQHCNAFEDSEENKIEYTQIFDNFVQLVESTIESRLVQNVKNFDMEEFNAMLEERKDQICGDIFDLLLSLGDFTEFKSLMLDYKAAAGFSGGQINTPMLGLGIGM
eukprot:g337.t1